MNENFPGNSFGLSAGGSFVLYAGFPLWLDDPSRGNPHDPHSPNYISPSPTASPTPLGADIWVKEYQSNKPIANAWVMPGTNAAAAKLTDANGHVFSPVSPSSTAPYYSPGILSVFQCAQSSVVADVFSPLYQAACQDTGLYYTVNAGSTSAQYAIGASFLQLPSGPQLSYSYIFPFPGTGSASTCYSAPSTYNLSALGYGFTGSLVGAYFSQGSLTAYQNVTVSASLSTTGYTPTSVPITPSGDSGWSSWYPSVVAGPSSSNFWLAGFSTVGGSGLTPSFTNLALPWGSSYFQYNLYGSSNPGGASHFQYCLLNASFNSFQWHWSPALPSAAIVTQAPSQASPIWQAQSNTVSTFSFNVWLAQLNQITTGQLNWVSLRYASAVPPSITLSLPTAFPAGVPSAYHLQAGLTYTAAVMQINLPSANPATLSTLVPNNFVPEETQDVNQDTW